MITINKIKVNIKLKYIEVNWLFIMHIILNNNKAYVSFNGLSLFIIIQIYL